MHLHKRIYDIKSHVPFFLCAMSLCTLAFISMSNLLPSLSGVFIIIFFLGAHVMELN